MQRTHVARTQNWNETQTGCFVCQLRCCCCCRFYCSFPFAGSTTLSLSRSLLSFFTHRIICVVATRHVHTVRIGSLILFLCSASDCEPKTYTQIWFTNSAKTARRVNIKNIVKFSFFGVVVKRANVVRSSDSRLWDLKEIMTKITSHRDRRNEQLKKCIRITRIEHRDTLHMFRYSFFGKDYFFGFFRFWFCGKHDMKYDFLRFQVQRDLILMPVYDQRRTTLERETTKLCMAHTK